MDYVELLRLVAALAFTLGLIALCAWLARRYGSKLPMLAASRGQRLNVVEWRPLDGRHQLYLLRRDNVEHLVILSPHAAPTVVESGIVPPAPSSGVGS